MIELKANQLRVSFPEVHPEAQLAIEFQRTFRIPDDGKDYPLPPGFGPFPLRHVDDFNSGVPEEWIRHGGVMLPMYQAEALWINFYGYYPFAVKVATGKIDALTGKEWSDGIHRNPQDYLVVPSQPWLDGYCVEKGIVRQFVAMPLGSGYSVEEQLTGKAEFGGIQLVAYPIQEEVFKRRRAVVQSYTLGDYCLGLDDEMGLAPGGRMKQEVYKDDFDFADWETEYSSRCFVHIANSLVWETITGERPPTVPPTAEMYGKAGLPWFEYYDEKGQALTGAKKFKKVKSVATMQKEKGGIGLPENESVEVSNLIKLKKGLKKGQVREGEF